MRSGVAELGPQLLLRQDDSQPGILDHVADAFSRKTGIERYIGSTGLEHRKRRDHHFDRAGKVHAHQPVWSHAELDKMRGELVGALVQCAIAELDVLEYQRNPFRGPLGLCLDLRMDASGHRVRHFGLVPLDQHLMPLGLREQRQVF